MVCLGNNIVYIIYIIKYTVDRNYPLKLDFTTSDCPYVECMILSPDKSSVTKLITFSRYFYTNVVKLDTCQH